MARKANCTRVQRPSSWVIIRKETGEAVLETFCAKIVAVLNTKKYKAVPILEYLTSLNARIKAADDAKK